jgi:hypothetical protein
VALLAVIDIDDEGTLKIERFKDALDSLGATVQRTSQQTQSQQQQNTTSTKQHTDALTRLIQEQKNYNAEVIKHVRTMQEMTNIFKVGTNITQQHATALGILNQQVQQATFLSNQQKASFAQLVSGMTAGTQVTKQQAAALQAAAQAHAQAGAAALGHQQSTVTLTTALTTLIDKERAYQTELVKHVRTMQEVANIFRAGTQITQQHKDALTQLNHQIQQATFLSNQQKQAFAQLTNSMTVGTAVTKQQAQALQQAAQEHARAAQAALAHQQSTFSLRGAVLGLVEALGATGIAFWLKNYITESFKIAARNEVLATSMGIVAKNVGSTNVEFETQAVAIRKLGITTKESRDAVIAFAQAELSLADASKLARAAQDLAAIGGMNSSEAFERLKTAIQIGQPLLLRQFGIMQNLNTLYSKHAQEIGKVGRELSTFEKRQALMNLIFREAEKVSGAYESTMNDVGKAMGSTSRFVEELQNKIGQAFLPIMKFVVDILNETLGRLAKMSPATLAVTAGMLALGTALTTVYAATKTLVTGLALLQAAGVATSVSMVRLQASMGWIMGIVLVLGLAATAWMAYHAAAEPDNESVVENIAKAAEKLQDLETRLEKVGTAVEALKKAKDAGKDLADSQKTLQKAVNDVNTIYPGLIDNLDLTTGAMDRQNDKITEVRNNLRGMLEDMKTSELMKQAAALVESQRLQSLMDAVNSNKFSKSQQQELEVMGLGKRRPGLAQHGDIVLDGGGFDIDREEAMRKLRAARAASDDLATRAGSNVQGIVSVLDPSKAVELKVQSLWESMEETADIRDRALQKLGKTRTDFETMSMKDFDTWQGKLKSQMEKIQNDDTKHGQAYKEAYESITQTSATAYASLQAADKALGEVSESSTEYVERLLRAEGIIKQLDKMGPAAAARYKKAAEGLDNLKVTALVEDLIQWQKKAKDVGDSVARSVGEMFASMTTAQGQAARQAAIELQDMQIGYARTTEARQEELSDRLVATTESEVDQRIKENDRYYRAFARTIEDEIRLIKRRQEQERIATKEKFDQETLALSRMMENARREFHIKVDTATAVAKAQKAIAMDLGEEELKQLILNEKAKFDERMAQLHMQGQAVIAETRRQEEEQQRAKEVLDNKYISDQNELLKRAADAHGKTNDIIRRESSSVWQAAKEGVAGYVSTAITGFSAIAAGAMSWKDMLLGILNQIKGTAMRVFTDMATAAVRGLAGIGTAGGGIGGMKQALGAIMPGMFGGGRDLSAPLTNYDAGDMDPVTSMGGSLMHPNIGPFMRFGGGGLMAATGAYNLWQSARAGQTGRSIMNGAMTGAGIGTMIMPGIGTAVGAGVGALAGGVASLFGAARGPSEEEIKDANTARQSFLSNFGAGDVGEANLRRLLMMQGGLMETIQGPRGMTSSYNVLSQFMGEKDPEKLAKLTTKIQEKLEKLTKTMEGLSMASEGVNARIEGFTLRMNRLVSDLMEGLDEGRRDDVMKAFEAAGGKNFGAFLAGGANGALSAEEQAKFVKMLADAQKTYESLSASVGAIFATTLAQTGDIMTALGAARDQIAQLNALREEFGFAEPKGLGKLGGLVKTIDANPDVALSLSGITNEIAGLSSAGLLDKDTFNRLGDSVDEQIKILRQRGVDEDTIKILVQPALQRLYEAQERFHLVAEGQTRELLRMGLEQNMIGKDFKSIALQQLDQLKLIHTALTPETGGSGERDAPVDGTDSGRYAGPREGATAAEDVTVVIPVVLDGATVAEVVVPSINDVVRLHKTRR